MTTSFHSDSGMATAKALVLGSEDVSENNTLHMATSHDVPSK